VSVERLTQDGHTWPRWYVVQCRPQRFGIDEIAVVRFADRPFQLAGRQPRREIDQRENRWRNGDVVMVGDLELDSAMNHDAWPPSVRTSRDFDVSRIAADSPECSGRLVAEGCIVTTAQHRSRPDTMAIQPRPPHRVHTAPDPVYPAPCEPMFDGP
jgi:hypothetical protein